MSNDLCEAICRQIETLRSGSLSFWGNWFGKPYDNLHRIVGASALDGRTTIYFDQGETLILEEPVGWGLDGGCLSVADAKQVRWQWFYYGRVPSAETLRFEEYGWEEDRLIFSTNFQPTRQPSLMTDLPAVQLHSMRVHDS